MKMIVFAAVLAVLTLAGCSKEPKTAYVIEYRFDNTKMMSDFLAAYEYQDSGYVNKFVSNRHSFDTVMVDGEMREYVSGSIKAVAHEGVNCLHVGLDGYRPGIGGEWRLDTVYALTPDEETYIFIGDDARWLSSTEWWK